MMDFIERAGGYAKSAIQNQDQSGHISLFLSVLTAKTARTSVLTQAFLRAASWYLGKI
jgi:hypothetical protein